MEKTSSVYQLKLLLKDIRPPIWRRILVSPHTTLARLHLIIQALMGWYNYHLYEFRLAGERYAVPHEDDDWYEFPKAKSTRYQLASLFKEPGDAIEYEYDFGDGWELSIQLEAIQQEPVENKKCITCLDGARCGPPDDSGGPLAYPEKLEILKKPRHKEYKELRQWFGPSFDPERFTVQEMNERLKEL